MTKRTKIMVASLVMAGLLAISLAGVALAADSDQPNNGNTPYYCWEQTGMGDHHGLGMFWSQEVSELLRLTPEEILAQLNEGKSLAEIAAAQGVDEDTLVEVILSAKKEFLQQRVQAGILTQEQADLMLKQMEAGVRQMVNRTDIGPLAGGAHCGYGQGGLGMGPGMMGYGGGQSSGVGKSGYGAGMGPGMLGYRGGGNNQKSYSGGVRFGGMGGMMGGMGGWR